MGNSHVCNLTSGKRLKFRKAEKLVNEDCVCAWVEFGNSIRTLTLAEQIIARNEQARVRERVAQAERPGLMFDRRNKDERRLVRAADVFGYIAAADAQAGVLIADAIIAGFAL